MTLSADLLRGYTDTLIMRQLAAADGYGYGISRTLAEKSGGVIQLKEATLYTAFRRMEENGYIRSYWGDEDTGARRRYYSLTEAGCHKLNEDTAVWVETRKVMDSLLEVQRISVSKNIGGRKHEPDSEKDRGPSV